MLQRPHILIADDDHEDRFMMSETFKELGHKSALYLVEDGRQLLEYLKGNPDEVKLIILDLNMPRLNGTDTLRLLKSDAIYNKIPVMIFSTSVNEIEKSTCMKLGAKEYIIKPTTYIEYVQTCEKIYFRSLES